MLPDNNCWKRRLERRPGLRQRQRGLTLPGLLYVLATLGVIVLVVVRSMPVYLGAYEVRSDLRWAARQPDLHGASARAIQDALQRRFDAGYVSNINGRDVAIQRTPDGGRELEAAYEIRRPLLFNIDMVYAFDETAKMPGGGHAQ